MGRREGQKYMGTYHYVREGMVRLPGTTDKVPHHPVNVILVIAYMSALVTAPVSEQRHQLTFPFKYLIIKRCPVHIGTLGIHGIHSR